MSMERWINEQTRLHRHEAAQMGKTLLELYGDVPLPHLETYRFSNENRNALKAEGYVFYELSGKSLASLKVEGRKFNMRFGPPRADLLASTSSFSEVAINPDPDKFFIKDSNMTNDNNHRKMIYNFSNNLEKKQPGVVALEGSMADYIDLAFAHLDKTGEYLFGEKYGNGFTRTRSIWANTFSNVTIGNFTPDNGLSLDAIDFVTPKREVFLAPLIVPRALINSH